MTANSKRIVMWAAIVGIIVIALALSFMPRPVTVDLADVRPGSLIVTLDEEGETRVHDVYTLSAPVAGRVQRIDWHVGDPVAANETVLAQIEPGDPSFLDPRSEAQARAAIQAAKAARDLAAAAVKDAEAQYEFARSEYARMQELIVEGSVSKRDLDSAERDFKTRRAGLDTARAAQQVRSYELELARAQLVSPAETQGSGGRCECISITSPVSGRILNIADRSERVVRDGDMLMQIGDPSDLEIVVDYLSMDAVKIQAGQRVIIDNWGGVEPLEGRVRLVEPFGFLKVSALGIEEQRVNVIIDFVSEEGWERLGHGYQVESRVVLWDADDTLTVPLTALFRDGETWALFVEDDGRARLRQVKVGQRNGVIAEIQDGLKAGERVVVHPSDRVTNGIRIESRD
ncbi:MAG: HlyD family efflux transporter periplasmic adaptor subunit [Gammaproteobacteria bacterium]|nr:HlyD family efflux transporter periplasmic adaptor subunit [Gammaproteobacteria bacterium]MDH5261967.1 HlyD family efflux transporter periplasmic adaptor subunit [Gammaproteobacteria bacterium]MDH5620991.1 HlyD family efflux transporter periplasmic adaptor subunit [Gammaproteobacteria bacterium]